MPPQKEKGFTLIELMLVVIIIGVLAAMVMPRLVGRSEQARATAAKADIASIGTALDMYELDIGGYPDKLDDLMANPGLGDQWKGPYLKKAPKDPWGRDYEYETSGTDADDYKLCSKGPKESQSEDDICNE
ncbi:MAG: type II secretion system protein GspG [Candidatus Omnitrophica bacterium]|nr:type II secretion system protein GspG [Candidatus Omnitrophota bacterium]